MNTKALLTLLALALWVIFCDWWWCTNKEKCDCDANKVDTEATAAAGASGTENSGIITFNAADAAPITSAAWASFSDSIANLIKGGKRLEIAGYYGSAEKNNTKFENLGVARADGIKQLMIAKLSGINSSRVSTKGILKDDLNTATAPYIASDMNVLDTVATPSDKGGVVETDSLHSLIYFPSGSSAKEASAEVDAYLVKLTARLKANGKSALVVGHTDNKGNPSSNVKLSKERAEFVKSILVKDGTDAAKLSTDGKGDKEPLGDNATDAGRKQNRRVEITIQKN
jgi:OmpA-OmpF porin, OOP family